MVQQGLVLRWLLGIDIQTGAADLAGVQALQQGLLIDIVAAG